jgi:hypothetical protein
MNLINIVELFPILLDNSSAEAHLRCDESAQETLAGAAWNELSMVKWNQVNKSKRLGAHGMARQKVWQ